MSGSLRRRTWHNQGVSRSRPPIAFSGSRLGWADLPRAVRARIVELCGAPVISEIASTSGFSPGYASVLELGNGTEVFVKAVSEEINVESAALARREITIGPLLPEDLPAPRLLWSDDDGTWVVHGIQVVHGRPPSTPWLRDELARCLEAVTGLAEVGTPAPAGLPELRETLDPLASSWRSLTDAPARLERALVAAGNHGHWVREHLDGLVDLAAAAPSAAVGGSLAHGDLRGDNMLLTPDEVWIVDWPHAAGGAAPWFDLLAMLPSVAMQDGGDPQELFWNHPVAAGADPDAVRAVLAGVAGYFLVSSIAPPPPGLTNLRAFQHAQAIPALEWLRRL